MEGDPALADLHKAKGECRGRWPRHVRRPTHAVEEDCNQAPEGTLGDEGG